MKITLSKHAGFCDGVKRAYEIVLDLAKNKKAKKPIYILGSLVHNSDVVREIEKLGIKKLKIEKSLEKTLLFAKEKIGTLVITAHGMGPQIYALAAKKKINLVDTTCPRVIKAQRLAKTFFERGRKIVIIGDKEHKESKGINEWASGKSYFLEKSGDFLKMKLKKKDKITIVSQTTQDEKFTEVMAEKIRKKYPETKVMKTICTTSSDRQNEVREMARKNNAVVIIGSPDSANSKRLWSIAKKINKNSYFIERADQLKEFWFKTAKKVGVTAGASAPDWIIKGVLEKLNEFKRLNFIKKELTNKE